ncbi:MAG: hypothetical protein HKL84_09000 [Acidimicrobiaceae bacterium]|nr:hypothetical protein [Acidimicrobiaceae bacterium]
MSQRVVDLESQLALLQTVIKKIDSDAYGKCEACDAYIDLEVLSADPQALFCNLHHPQGST